MNAQISPSDSLPEKTDVAVNIFAKPFQTALSLLSLIKHSHDSIGTIWLQFEPVGSMHDPITSYFIADYLKENGWQVMLSQPNFWLDLEAIDQRKMNDPAYRAAIRYQCAFENSKSRLLFLMHNDVYIFRDILKPMIDNLGSAFAIGQIGQCWNCPASKREIANGILSQGPCSPDSYAQNETGWDELRAFYSKAREKGVFVRPYDVTGFDGEFKTQPWPLPECRVNEWACLLNLELAQPLCQPKGSLVPPGAYIHYGDCTLDIGVSWFRQMHGLGYRAKHIDVSKYLKHWVGTGNNTTIKYLFSEDRALKLLIREFPEYMQWLERKTGKTFFSPH